MRTLSSALRSLAVCCALLLVTACLGDGPTDPPAITSVSITPRQPVLAAIGDSVTLAATAHDANGNPLSNVSITWESSAPGVASVSTTGVVIAADNGTALITARVGSASDTTTVTVAQRVTRITFLTRPEMQLAGRPLEPAIQVALEDARGRRVTAPTGPVTLSLEPTGSLGGTTSVTPAGGIASFAEAIVPEAGRAYRLRAEIEEVPPAHSIFFDVHLALAQVSAGGVHTCGLTAAGTAYCWGENAIGRVGDGTTTTRSTPVRVATTRSFVAIDAGSPSTWALTAEGMAFGWGSNILGEVITAPTALTGSHTFTSLETRWHTCGLTAEGRAYCWGTATSAFGAGSSDGTPVMEPTLAMDGLIFKAIATGSYNTCGIANDGAAWCAGEGFYGQLGNGSTFFSSTPVAVVGGLRFTALGVGDQFACGIATDGLTYCWGRNEQQQLGDPAAGAQSSFPLAVAGNHRFTTISLGARHACGLTADGTAYCWGDGRMGMLGTGNHENTRATPVAVAGSHKFATISAGSWHTCGITRQGFTYCWGDNSNGALGTGGAGFPPSPTLIAPPLL